MAIIDAFTSLNQLSDSRFKSFTRKERTLYWRGLLYIPGHVADEDSVSTLLARLESTPLARAVTDLRGTFGAILVDHEARTLSAFVDNAGMYKLFHDSKRISTSFLGLSEHIEHADCALDEAVVLEFLEHGVVFGKRTFLSGINKLDGREILQLDVQSSAGIRTLLKEAVDAEKDCDRYLEELPEILSVALAERRVSVDVTGGYDSRVLLAVLLNSNLSLDLALSGHSSSRDAEVARQVAAIAGKPLRLTQHTVESDVSTLDSTLKELHRIVDAQGDPLRFHRLLQYDTDRLSREIDTFVYGGAGEIYKDHQWQQDFPFKAGATPRIQRYYDLRVAAMTIRPLLTPKAAALLDTVKQETVARFSSLVQAEGKTSNVDAYLAIYCLLRSPQFYGRTLTSHINLGLDPVAPYLEPSMYNAVYRLPVRQRLLNGFHRRMIQTLYPPLSDVPLSDGYKPRAGWRFASSLPRMAAADAARLARKISQRLTNRSRFVVNAASSNDAPAMEAMLSNSRRLKRAIEALKQAGIFDSTVDAGGANNRQLGRALTVGTLLADRTGA